MQEAPTSLRVNGRVDPLCVETPPAFSWIPPVDRQTAFHVEVDGLWDSGEITSSDSVAVPYGGLPLQSEHRYHWRVRVRGTDGAWSAWSRHATWKMGLLNGEPDWDGAAWIGGRLPEAHDWSDLTVSVRFRGTRTDMTTGVALLVRAEAIGKAWNEALRWSISSGGDGGLHLAMRAQHNLSEHNPQSETNPVATGVRVVDIGAVPIPPQTGLTQATWDQRDHDFEVDVKGLSVTTRVNGVEVDQRALEGDQIRVRGSVGFAASTSAIVREVRISSPDGDHIHDLRRGANPFESGIGTMDGLTFVGKSAVLPPANPAPLLRTSVGLPEGAITEATLYLATGGFAELSVNGEALPGRMLIDQSAYDRTVLYDGFDVTHAVVSGINILAAELGRGWYGVTTPTEWYWHLAPYVGAPRLRAKLRVRYADGRSVVAVTDGTWDTASGPTTFDSVYSGEKYDARRAEALGDWRLGATSDADEWSPASVVLPPGSCSAPEPLYVGRLPDTVAPEGLVAARVRAAESEPVSVIEKLKPRAWSEPEPGVWVADFGQIVTGFPVLTLRDVAPDAAGSTLRLRGTNTIAADGMVEEENWFHDANLQVNEFTVGYERDQTWEARFNNWGFRYVEVRNLWRAPDPDLLSVNVARTGFARTGRIETDSPLLERIVNNLEWAQQNNNVGKPTDTPSREKNGWTGDTLADSDAQCIVWDLQAHLTKYLRGFADGQISTGQLPMILPAAKGGYGYAGTPGWNATWEAVPAWDAAYFVIPWELWLYYGTTALFAELYPHQERLMRYYETLFRPEDGYHFTSSLGAYSGAEPAGDNAVISLQCYIRAADYMRDVGGLLGSDHRAAFYEELAAALRRTFVERYWDAELGCFTGGSISSENTLAVAWDIVPTSDHDTRAALVGLLAQRIREAGHHIVNDMFGSRYELNLLSDHGYTDVALQAVMEPGPPGYVDQIARGATSLWEMWTGLSQNHHYRSNVATWLYQSLAGIRPTAPGYASLRIRPLIPTVDVVCEVPTSPDQDNLVRRPLHRFGATMRTVRGFVESRWDVSDDGAVALDVAIPPNTTAEVWVPGGMVCAVPPGRHRFQGWAAVSP